LTTTSTRERTLTPPEKDERTQVLLALLDERDTIRLRVRASRDELRQWRVEARNLEAQIDDVRSEIRTGIVTEPAQMTLPNTEPVIQGRASDLLRELRLDDNDGMETEDECSARTVREEMGISGSSDEPDPETDPPPAREPNRGVEVYRMFDMNYPAPKTKDHLYAMLAQVLTPAEYALLPESCPWRPSSGEFDAVSHWARVENAHKVHATRPPTAGITLPARLGMPGALQQALATSQPKKPAKAAKKKRSRKAAA
jgi:hypothetical protein